MQTPLLVSPTALASPEEGREKDDFLCKGYRPGALRKSFKKLVCTQCRVIKDILLLVINDDIRTWL